MYNMRGLQRFRFMIGCLLLTLLVETGVPGLPISNRQKVEASGVWDVTPYFVALPDNQVRVSWLEPEYGSSGKQYDYEVSFYALPGRELLTAPGSYLPDSSTEWVQTGLDPSTRYEVQITATERGETQPYDTLISEMRLLDFDRYHMDMRMTYTNNHTSMKIEWNGSKREGMFNASIYSYDVAVWKVGSDDELDPESIRTSERYYRTQNSKYVSILDGFEPGSRYFVSIRLYNLLDFLDSSIDMFVTVPGQDVDPEEPVDPPEPPVWPLGAELLASRLSAWEGFKLEWPQAAGEIDHYELSWNRNDGETVVMQLPAEQRDYLLNGAPDFYAPGDRISYSVRAVGKLPAGQQTALMSEPLSGTQIIPRLELNYDTVGAFGYRALKAGLPIEIALEASPGYTATAVVLFESWNNAAGELQSAPVQRELEVALAEQAEPGRYLGAWTAEETEKIIRASSVYVKLSKDGVVVSADDTITDAEGEFWNLPFTGKLVVDVAGEVAGASLFITSEYGRMPPIGRILEGAGQHEFPYWYPGAVTAEVKLNNDTFLVRPTDAIVKSFETTTLALQAGPPELPPELAVKVRGSSDQPIEGVTVQAFVNGGWRTGRTDASGELVFHNKLIAGASIAVRVLDVPLAYQLPDSLTHVMLTGHNELEIDLEARPMIMVSGQVKLDSAPAAGRTIEFVQLPPSGSGFNTPYRGQTITDLNGVYTVQLYRGLNATVDFGDYNAYYDELRTSFPVNETASNYSFDLYTRSDVAIEGTIRKHLRGVLRETLAWEELGYAEFRQRAVYVQKIPGGHKQYFSRYPVSVKGKPGDQFNVCIKDVQFVYTCDLITIDDTFTGHAILDFYDLGSQLKLSFGQELVQAGAIYRITGLTNGFAADYSIPSSGEAEQIAIPSAGEYTLTLLTLQEGRMLHQLARRFSIREGQLLDLGRIDLSQADQISGYMTLDHLTYYPGEEIRLKLGLNGGNLQDKPGAGNLKIKLPAAMSFYGVMPFVDGRLSPYFNAEQPLNDVLTIPLSHLQQIEFGNGDWLYVVGLIGTDYVEDAIAVHAWLEYKKDGVDVIEPIGAAQAEIQPVSLDAPGRISSLDLALHGKAILGSLIYVYHDQTLLGQAYANGTKDTGILIEPTGTWSLRVRLPDPPDNAKTHSYELYAVANTGGQLFESQHVTTRFSVEALPSIKEVSLTTRGFYQTQKKTFNPAKGIQNFPYILEPGVTEIAVTFDDPMAVSNVVVHISPFTLPAVKGAEGVYKAYIHYSKASEIRELSGGVYVSYDRVPAVDEDASFDSLEQLRDALPWWLKDAEAPSDGDVEAIEQSGLREAYKLNQSLPQRLGASATLETSFYVERQVDYTIDRKPKMEILGKTVYGAKGSASFTAGSRSPFPGPPTGYRDSAAMVASFLRSADSRNMTIRADFSGYLQYEDPGNGGEVRILSAPVQIAKTGANIVIEGVDIGLTLEGSGGFESTMDGIQDRIRKVYAGCPSQRAQRYHAAYEDIMSDMMAAESAKWAASLGLFALGAGAPGPGTLIAGLTLVAGQGLGKVIDHEMANELAEIDRAVMRDVQCDEDTLNPKDKKPEDSKQKVDAKQNLVASPVWIYDPSGFTYETVQADRLEGVTATVFYKDEAADEWVEWDAAWFEQQNPQQTGADGRYHWDVPPGLWKIQLEKEGYATTFSEELRVLPPHFDVNLPMVALTSPVAERVRGEDNGKTLIVDFSKYMRVDEANRPVNGGVTVMRGTERIGGTLVGADVVEVDRSKLAKRWVYEIDGEHAVQAGDLLEVIIHAGAVGYNDLAMTSDQRFEVTVKAADNIAPAAVSSAELLVGDSGLFVTWRDPSDEDLSEIKVEWKQEFDQHYREKVISAGIGYTELPNLRVGELYHVRIAAIDDTGNLSPYVELAQRIFAAKPAADRTAPAKVSNAMAQAIGQTIKISWTDPISPDLAGVMIRWREAGADEDADFVMIDRGEQMYVVTEGLERGRTYEISLVAEDAAGNQSGSVLLHASIASGTDGGSGNGTGTGSGPDAGPGAGGAVQPSMPDAVMLDWAKFAPNSMNPQGASVWDGQLWIQLDGGQLPAPVNGGGLAIAQAAGVVAPKGDRYHLLRPAFGLTMFEAGEPLNGTSDKQYDSQALRIFITLEEQQLIGLDPNKLGVYRAVPGHPGEWAYVGGKWHAERRQLEIRVDAVNGDYGVLAVMAYQPYFTDLMGHWSQKAADLLAARHLATGVGDSRFAPQRLVTRAEFATFMVRILDYAAGDAVTGKGFDAIVEENGLPLQAFADVSDEGWYVDMLERAVSYRLIQGDGSLLHPEHSATREESAVFIKRLLDRLLILGVIRVEDLEESAPAPAPFRDATEISGWARESVEQLQVWGIVKGQSKGRFAPKQATTRAELAQMLANILTKCKLL